MWFAQEWLLELELRDKYIGRGRILFLMHAPPLGLSSYDVERCLEKVRQGAATFVAEHHDNPEFQASGMRKANGKADIPEDMTRPSYCGRHVSTGSCDCRQCKA